MSDDWLEIQRRATERASRYAPPPREDPVHAGIAGVAIVGVVLTLFLGFAGIDQDAVLGASAATLAIGYLAPYLYLKHQANRHYAAVVKEHAAIVRELAAPPLMPLSKGGAD